MKFMEKALTSLTFSILFLLSSCGQAVSRNPLRVDPSINPIVVDPGTGGIPSSPFGEVLGKHSYSVIVNRALVRIGAEDSGKAENHYREKYKKDYSEYWKNILGAEGDFDLKEEKPEE